MLPPMTSLRQTGFGIFSARVGRGRLECAEKRFLINIFLALSLGGRAWAGVDNTNEAPQRLRLELDLVDGSCVIGAPKIESLCVQTPYAKMAVPLKQISTVKIADDHETASLDLCNGDKLNGVVTLGPIVLVTVFGEVSVGVEHIKQLEVIMADGGQSEGLRNELVLHYSFDKDEGEKVTDLSGHNNHGKNHGATFASEGRRLNVLELDGRSAYVEIGAAAMTSLPTWADYTISVWFLNNGKGDQGRGYGQKILDKTVMYHDFYLCVNSDGHLGFHATEPDRPGGLGDGTHDYRDGKWHHAVVVKNGAHGELWVDGELKSTADNLQQVHADTPLLIGYSMSPDAYQQKYWSGRIDELMIFKKALSKGSIRALSTP